MADKVTLRFETIDNSDSNNDILISGPIKLYTDTANNITGIFNTIDEIIALSSDMKTAIKESGDILYVKNVTYESDWIEYNKISTAIGFSYGSTEPTSNLISGILFFNTTSNALEIYNGTEWLASSYLYFYGDKYPSSPNKGNYFFNTSNNILYVYNGVDINSRGAYYSFDEDNDPIELLLGTHSHVNKDILDKISDVDANSLDSTEKKVLTIRKTETILPGITQAKVGYTTDWSDLPIGIPEVPITANEDKLYYLTSKKNGAYTWDNLLVPSQTFTCRRLTIISEADYADKTDENKALLYAIGPTNTLSFTNINYTKGEDQILLFNGNFFVGSYKYDSINNLTDETLTFDFTDNTIADPTEDENSSFFDIGDVVMLLIIRSGAAGLFDNIREELFTKEDFVAFQSHGILNLKNYATKNELADKADRDHVHLNYALSNHNHDLRYAFAHHTHPEYAKKGDLTSIFNYKGEVTLYTNLPSSPLPGDVYKISSGTDINKLYAWDITNSTWNDVTSILSLDSNTMTEIDTAASNAQNALDKVNLLTDSLTAINSNITKLETYTVEADEVKINNPIIINNNIGSYKTGDTIDPEDNVYTVISKMLTSPTVIAPTLNVTYDNVPPALNSAWNKKFILIFSSNAAGALTDFKISIMGTQTIRYDFLVSDTGSGIIYDSVKKTYTKEFSTNDISNLFLFTNYNSSTTIRIEANYAIGILTNDYQYPSGTIQKNIVISPERLSYIGLSENSITDDSYSDLTAYYPIANNDIIISSNSGAMELNIAIPNDIAINDVIYKNQEISIMDILSIKNITISSEDYTIYTYTFLQAISDPISFIIKFKEAE